MDVGLSISLGRRPILSAVKPAGSSWHGTFQRDSRQDLYILDEAYALQLYDIPASCLMSASPRDPANTVSG